MLTKHNDVSEATALVRNSQNTNSTRIDGVGIHGFLYMRKDGASRHRMKKHYNRLMGVNIFRFATVEAGADISNAIYEAELTKVESWDGKSIFHNYAHAFKIHTTLGIFNVQAESALDKKLWIKCAMSNLGASEKAMQDLNSDADDAAVHPLVNFLTPAGNLKEVEKAPTFKNQLICMHPTCNTRFQQRRRKHHCRSCGNTVCSEHGSRFMPLVNLGYNDAVRVCVSCARVQRFLQLMRTVEQMYIAQRLVTSGVDVFVTDLSSDDIEMRDQLKERVAHDDFGVSDAIQELHLHRRSCDEIYEIIANKLVYFVTANVEDFEFFLPQIFHMWATLDALTNIRKAALLDQVLMTAARVNIKLAQLIYWHTRAAIDDSCGLGFGQSERSILPSKHRKFPSYKLMMINLEALVAGASWTFISDLDLVTSDTDARMIQSMFNRMTKLQEIDVVVNLSRSRGDTLGSICSAIMSCGIPENSQVRDTELVPKDLTSHQVEYKSRLAGVFKDQIQFMQSLTDVAERLRHVEPVKERKNHLPAEINALKVPSLAFFPLGSCNDNNARILHITKTEGTVFSTKARAPTLMYIEVEVSDNGMGASLWHHQSITTRSPKSTLLPRMISLTSSPPQPSPPPPPQPPSIPSPTLSIDTGTVGVESDTSSTIFEDEEEETISPPDTFVTDETRRLTNSSGPNLQRRSSRVITNRQVSMISLTESFFEENSVSNTSKGQPLSHSDSMSARVELMKAIAIELQECIQCSDSPRRMSQGDWRSRRSDEESTHEVEKGVDLGEDELSSRDLTHRLASFRKEVDEEEATPVDDIINALAGSFSATSDDLQHPPSNLQIHEVEKLSREQMTNIVTAMDKDCTKRGQKPNEQLLPPSFYGSRAVSWMLKNGVAMNVSHAVWLGSEMMAMDLLRDVKGEVDAFMNDDHQYVLVSTLDENAAHPLPLHTQLMASLSHAWTMAQPTTPVSATPPSVPRSDSVETHPGMTSNDGSTRQSQSRSIEVKTMALFGFHRPSSSKSKKKTDDHSLSFIDASISPQNSARLLSPRLKVSDLDQELVLSSLTRESSNYMYDDDLPLSQTNTLTNRLQVSGSIGTRTGAPLQSIFERFNPEAALESLTALEKHVKESLDLPSDTTDNVAETALLTHLGCLRNELETITDHFIERRTLQVAAVASAFGERHDLKIKRIQAESSFGQVKNWDCLPLIIKSHDDLRQEVFCLQLIRQFQDIFDHTGLPLRLLPYDIVATSASTGFIEVIKDAVSLDQLKKTPGYTNLSQHFRSTYGEEQSDGYKQAMSNFVSSMAAYSLVCYLLQIKDRHNGNIMITSEGHIVHIDFGFILGIAPGGVWSLETAPFKLTLEMLEAMGGTTSDYYKEYVILLVQGFLALQQHADTVLMMMAIMVTESSFPCFISRNPRAVLTSVKGLFKLNLDQRQVVKHVLWLVSRSQNSYRTRQYDRFQKLTNGIMP